MSGFPIDEGRTLLEVPEDALDLLQGTSEVFGDLGSKRYVISVDHKGRVTHEPCQ